MKKYLYIIVCFFLYSCVFCREITRIVIYSESWNLIHDHRVSYREFMEFPSANKTIIPCFDTSFINEFKRAFLLQREDTSCRKSIDVRSTFLVNYSDNTCDTVSFGLADRYMVNNNVLHFEDKHYSVLYKYLPLINTYTIEYKRNILKGK